MLYAIGTFKFIFWVPKSPICSRAVPYRVVHDIPVQFQTMISICHRTISIIWLVMCLHTRRNVGISPSYTWNKNKYAAGEDEDDELVCKKIRAFSKIYVNTLPNCYHFYLILFRNNFFISMFLFAWLTRH